jgi:GT2 family glycosyltransferase
MTLHGRASPTCVSVIIPSLDGEPFLRAQLEALTTQDYAGPWQVVVADNGSTDSTVQVARSYVGRLPGLTIIETSGARSQAAARNAGVAVAQGDLLVFCDQDDVVDRGWLSAMVRGAARFDIVQSSFDERKLNDRLALRWFSPPPRQTSERLPRHLGFLPAIRGAGVAIWRDVFDAMGGFDGRFVGGGEDAAFAWHAQLRGFTVGRAPEAVVAYRYRSTPRQVYRQAWLGGRSDALLFRQFRSRGLCREPVSRTARAWASILVWTPVALVNPVRRGLWARYAGNRVGRLAGSWQFRVWFP